MTIIKHCLTSLTCLCKVCPKCQGEFAGRAHDFENILNSLTVATPSQPLEPAPPTTVLDPVDSKDGADVFGRAKSV